MNPNFKRSVSPDGRKTFIADAAIKAGQAVKLAADDSVTPCTAAIDAAVGIARTDAEAGDTVAIALLGITPGTVIAVAGGTLATGDKVNPIGTAWATGNTLIGIALNSADKDGEVELAHTLIR